MDLSRVRARLAHRLAGRMPTLALAGLVTLLATPAFGVVRTCGPDAVANTAAVLCAPPSGPCTATSVIVRAHLAIPDGSRCAFDLGGRALVVERTIEVTGRGPGLQGEIDVFNAGNIEVTSTGKLKARGDFAQPHGYIVGGGTVRLESAGMVTIRGLLDVVGDSAGAIHVTASGDIEIASTAHLRGDGLSSFLDEGERYADGALVTMVSDGGSIRINGAVTLRGQRRAYGGSLNLDAARDIVIAHKLMLTGYEGGTLDAFAGDHLTITRSIDADAAGDGTGGEIILVAGYDVGDDAVPGGNLVIDGATITLRGSGEDEDGGDGGYLEITTRGNITMTNVVVRVDAHPGFNGDSGSVDLATESRFGVPIEPLDGTIEIDGIFSLRGGAGFGGGSGGDFCAEAGRNIISRAQINAGAVGVADGGGSIQLAAKGEIQSYGPLSAGSDGFILVEAGYASQGGLTIGANVLNPARSEAFNYVTLSGCTLTVAPDVKIDAGQDLPSDDLGPSVLQLISVAPMELGAGSRYLAGAGAIELVYPPGADPVIGNDVVFDGERIDIQTTGDLLPPCPAPGCGNGILESGEECDDGNLFSDDGCSPQCEIQCEPIPRSACARPAVEARATLGLRNDADDARDALLWRWLRGDATTLAQLGDPRASDDYALCIYDAALGSAPLVFAAVAPAGGLCRGRPCWRENARGFTYDDPDRTPSGVDAVRLETGGAGDAKIVVAVKGAQAVLPVRQLTLPAVVQLQGSHGACWEATYSAAQKNDGTRFEAVAD